ncbi:MAG: hypothetical protein SPL80_00950 [Bacilli bacterium]|nr:hypothetical protein [Bacilli bacterium]
MFALILKNLKENIVSYIFVGIGIALSLVVCFYYPATGVTAFTPKINPTIVIFSAISAGIGVISFCAGFKTVKYLAFVMGLFAFLSYAREEVTYVANIFTGIDGTSFSLEFILTFAFLIVAMLAFLLGGIIQKEILFQKKPAAKEN